MRNSNLGARGRPRRVSARARRLVFGAVVVVVLAAAATAVAQSQRFSDVPADHPDAAAIEWAASVGVTQGFEDGTFRPDEPLPRWAARIFLDRFYDDVLEASESDKFTRANMMRVLYEMAGEPAATTTTTTNPASGVQGWTGDVWLGTSDFVGVGRNLSTICVHGDATEVVETSEGQYWIFVWSAVDPDRSDGYGHRVDFEVTGPRGASRQFTHYGPAYQGGADSHYLSVGPQSYTHINAGETSWSYSSEGVWAAISISYEGLWFPSRKEHQQWAASIDCSR